MNRLVVVLFLGLLITHTGCYKNVCPAYHSAFIPEGEPRDNFFAYVNADSSINSGALYADRPTTWYGTAKEPTVLPVARLFVRDPYGVDEQFSKVISTKPYKSPQLVSDSLETEYTYNSTDSTLTNDSLFVPEDSLSTTLEEDSAEVLIDSAYYAYDQYYYRMQYGKQLEAFEALNVVDTVIRFRDMPDSIPVSDSLMLVKRKWYQFFAPNYAVIRTKFPEPDTVEVDSLNLDYLAEDLFDIADSSEVPIPPGTTPEDTPDDEDW